MKELLRRYNSRWLGANEKTTNQTSYVDCACTFVRLEYVSPKFSLSCNRVSCSNVMVVRFHGRVNSTLACVLYIAI